MSLEVADRLFLYDKLSRGGATSYESIDHYPTSSDEANLNKNDTKDGGFHSPPSPGAPAGDHHRRPEIDDQRKNTRTRSTGREPSARTTKSNTTSDLPNTQHTKRHSAPNSAENAKRKQETAAKRVNSAKTPEHRNTSLQKVHRHNPKGVSSASNFNSGKNKSNRSADPDAGMKAVSSSNLVVTRRSAKDSQRQMRQKAKLAIVMWKERMSKKKEPMPSNLVSLSTARFSVHSPRDSSTGRKSDEFGGRSLSGSRNVPRHDCQVVQSAVQPEVKREESFDREIERSQIPSLENAGTSVDIIESPIPRSSPDDLSVSDGSTKGASSSQFSQTALTNNKRNSASSRETQRSKIPRPVDGQGDKALKKDSGETTSVLSSSSEKEVTSQDNLLTLLPDELIFSQLNTPPEVTQSTSVQECVSVSIPPREKRRRRGAPRHIQSSDEDDAVWPGSPSAAGTPPMGVRSKRTRHQSRKSPKPMTCSSPSLLLGKSTECGVGEHEVFSGSCSGADSDGVSAAAVIVPRRKPYLQRKSLDMKLGGVANDLRDHVVKKRQRQEIYALNQVMTALEYAQFEHFCRTRNIPLNS